MRLEQRNKLTKKTKKSKSGRGTYAVTKLASEASCVPGDANTRPDLCCRLGKVSHLHCSRILQRTRILQRICAVCVCEQNTRMFSVLYLYFHAFEFICVLVGVNHDLFVVLRCVSV